MQSCLTTTIVFALGGVAAAANFCWAMQERQQSGRAMVCFPREDAQYAQYGPKLVLPVPTWHHQYSLVMPTSINTLLQCPLQSILSCNAHFNQYSLAMPTSINTLLQCPHQSILSCNAHFNQYSLAMPFSINTLL